MILIKKVSRSLAFWGILWVFWMGVIFFFSSLPGSPVYYEPPFWLVIERKSAHIVEYAVLTILSLQVFSLLYPKESLKKIMALAFVWSVMYAVSDELHQFFTPHRGAYFRDVFIDIGGIVLALLPITFIFYKRKNAKIKKSS